MNVFRGSVLEQENQRMRLRGVGVRLLVILMMPLVFAGNWYGSPSGYSYNYLLVVSVFWTVYIQPPQVAFALQYLPYTLGFRFPEPMQLAQIALVVIPGVYFFLRYSSSGRGDESKVAGLTLALNLLVLGILEASNYSGTVPPIDYAQEGLPVLSSVGVLSMLFFIVLPTVRVLLGDTVVGAYAPAPDFSEQSRRLRRLRSMPPGRILLYLGLLLPSRLSASIGTYDVAGGYWSYSSQGPLLQLVGYRSWSSSHTVDVLAAWLSGTPLSLVSGPVGFAALNIDLLLGWVSLLYLLDYTLRYSRDRRSRRTYWKSVAFFCAVAMGGPVVYAVAGGYPMQPPAFPFPVFVVVSLISIRILRSRRTLMLREMYEQGALDMGYPISVPALRLKMAEPDVKIPLYYVAVSRLKRRLRKMRGKGD